MAAELGETGAASIVDFTPEAIAGAIEQLLTDQTVWTTRRLAALELARKYDWRLILSGALEWLGFD